MPWHYFSNDFYQELNKCSSYAHVCNQEIKSRGNNYKYQYYEYIPYQMFILVNFNSWLRKIIHGKYTRWTFLYTDEFHCCVFNKWLQVVSGSMELVLDIHKWMYYPRSDFKVTNENLMSCSFLHPLMPTW